MNKYFFIRLIGSVFIFVFVLFQNYLNYTNKYIKFTPTCFNDMFIESTYTFYSFLKIKNFRQFLQIFIFGYLDLVFLFVIYLWIVYGKTWRPVLTLIIFYSFREICIHIFVIRPDEDLIWKSPGIPSLTVSYHQKSEFFFSGIIGLFLICILELKSFDYKKLSIISCVFMIMSAVLLVSLRAQYYISLFSGFFAAHYSHLISDKFNYLLNDVYDFDPELTEKRNNQRRNEKIKNVIEMSIKKFKYDKIKFKRLNSENIDNDNVIRVESYLEEENKDSNES